MLKIGKEYNKKYAEISIAGRMWVIDADANENLGELSKIANLEADKEQALFSKMYDEALTNFDTDSLASEEFKQNVKKSCEKLQKLIDGILTKAHICYDEDMPDGEVDNSAPSRFIFSNISASWVNHSKILALIANEISRVINENTIDVSIQDIPATSETKSNV